MLYKVEGNSLGHSGSCKKHVLQEMQCDDVTLVGARIQFLDRDESDSPLGHRTSSGLLKGSMFYFIAPAASLNWRMTSVMQQRLMRRARTPRTQIPLLQTVGSWPLVVPQLQWIA